MNKTILITSGASVASLAIGGAIGYIVAKQRFESGLPDMIDHEIEATKKYYVDLINKMKEESSESEDLEEEDSEDFEPEDLEDYDDPEELSESDRKALAKRQRDAQVAQTNYQAFADKPPLDELVQHMNIFSESVDKSKKKLPPRDGASGRFVAKHSADEVTEDDPFIITQEEFLNNEPEHTQVTIMYFPEEKILLNYDKEEVDVNLVGEANLTLFPDVAEDEASIICVRNNKKSMDYEITLCHDNLTELMGFGESDKDLDPSMYL